MTLNSEGVITTVFSYIGIIIGVIFGSMSILFTEMGGKVIGAVVLFCCYLFYTKGIYKVIVHQNHFEVKKARSSFSVSYADITTLYRNREGFAPIYIYVVKYYDKNMKVKKFTFDANDKQIKQIKELVNAMQPDIYVYTKE
jgi:hypothetical protein